jgi:hypothetical protein
MKSLSLNAAKAAFSRATKPKGGSAKFVQPLTQRPPAQAFPPLQIVVQVPQWDGSLVKSTQLLPQQVPKHAALLQFARVVEPPIVAPPIAVFPAALPPVAAGALPPAPAMK